MKALKTFIVEDSAVIRENLIATLEELVPVEVVGTAVDEAGAIQWLSRMGNAVDLVIVDIFLKSGSGLGVLRASQGESHRSKPLCDAAVFAGHGHDAPASRTLGRRHQIVLSNYATDDMRRKCLDLGADRVFDKSNEIDDLIAYCERLADEAQALDAAA